MDNVSNSSEIIGDSTLGELSEIHVAVDGNDEMGDGSLQKPFKSLECAVNNSKDASSIYLNEGEYVGEHNRNIKIDKSISIIGNSNQNTIINGESCGRLFNVTSAGSLTLINVTLLNGYSAENGGSIYNDGGKINFKNCIVMNSHADNYGGVVYNNLGALNIENSSFINNSAYNYGGVLYTLGITFIKNSNFTENVLTFDWGVAACIAAGGKIDLDGCTFCDCFTAYSAGALLNLGNATINNCRFERLSTNYTGGAISNHNYMVINNSYFGYNDVQYYAGAILAPPSGQHVVTKVYNTIFERNHAGYHGAVSNNFKDTELFMENCAFYGNYINRFYHLYGDIALDDNATVQYCWWGENEISPYYYSAHDSERHPEKINASRWLVMTFTSNDDVIYRNEINQLTVSIKHYFDNETKEIYDYDEDINLPLEVTFYTDVGTLATKKLVNGVATLDFNPQKDASVVYAKIDSQILKIDNFQLRETRIIADDFEKCYGSDSKLVIKLVKDNSVPISDTQLTVSLGGNLCTIKTDGNGQAKLPVNLAPNRYAATITFEGNDNYLNSTKSVNVVVKKTNSKLTANAKTFLDTDKNKKYTVILKDANGKVIKNAPVTLKVNGVTYSSRTNGNGVATFYLKKLTRTGTLTATVTYSGDNKYNKVIANAKITVKSTWKTISKGNKNKVMVKKIQRALNGFHIKYKGHYLKVDGIYQANTVMAVKLFQKAKGLKVTGKVDYKTAQKLKLVK